MMLISFFLPQAYLLSTRKKKTDPASKLEYIFDLKDEDIIVEGHVKIQQFNVYKCHFESKMNK